MKSNRLRLRRKRRQTDGENTSLKRSRNNSESQIAHEPVPPVQATAFHSDTGASKNNPTPPNVDTKRLVRRPTLKLRPITKKKKELKVVPIPPQVNVSDSDITLNLKRQKTDSTVNQKLPRRQSSFRIKIRKSSNESNERGSMRLRLRIRATKPPERTCMKKPGRTTAIAEQPLCKTALDEFQNVGAQTARWANYITAFKKFHEDANYKALCAPNPATDIATIEKKLSSGGFSSAKDFYNEIQKFFSTLIKHYGHVKKMMSTVTFVSNEFEKIWVATAAEQLEMKSSDRLQQEHYLTILNLLWDVPEAKNFQHPIDPIVDKCSAPHGPYYFDIIKKPICLLDIKRKVKANMYKSKEKFQEDLDLLFSNCQLYFNQTAPETGKDMIAAAQKLQEKYKSLLKKLEETKDDEDIQTLPSGSQVNPQERVKIGMATPHPVWVGPRSAKPASVEIQNEGYFAQESRPDTVRKLNEMIQAKLASLPLLKERPAWHKVKVDSVHDSNIKTDNISYCSTSVKGSWTSVPAGIVNRDTLRRPLYGDLSLQSRLTWKRKSPKKKRVCFNHVAVEEII